MDKTKRNLAKALSVAGPLLWQKPAIESIVLPAHALTSGCVVPAGCYSNSSRDVSVQWPGGGGIQVAEIHAGLNCDNFLGSGMYLAASSQDEAEALLDCQDGLFPQVIADVPNSVCGIWECND